MTNPTPVACNTVLVIEDDNAIREALSTALTLEGYEVLTATNGKEALDILRVVARPCLVLMDLMMPVMSGREFLDQIKTDVILAPIPVFIISATASKENTQGAIGFIKKPANLEVVLKMVEVHCKKNRAGS